jgi:hypothetical protein
MSKNLTEELKERLEFLASFLEVYWNELKKTPEDKFDLGYRIAVQGEIESLEKIIEKNS